MLSGTVTNNVSGSCGSGDAMLYELRGESINPYTLTHLLMSCATLLVYWYVGLTSVLVHPN